MIGIGPRRLVFISGIAPLFTHETSLPDVVRRARKVDTQNDIDRKRAAEEKRQRKNKKRLDALV